MDTKERSQYGEEGSDGISVLSCWTFRGWDGEKKRMKRGWGDEKRGEVIKSHRIMNCLLNSNSLLLHLLQIWSSRSITNMARVLSLFLDWTHIDSSTRGCFFLLRSVRQVGTRGWKGIRPLCHVGPPQQSYLVWACHLSGQWMHEIREGEEEENVSTTRRRRGIGEGRDLGREGRR